MSAEKNELSQWRAYGGSSGSFARGFQPGRLIAAVKKKIQTRDSIFTSAFTTKVVASPFANSSSTACFTNTAFSEQHTNRVGDDYQQTLDLVHEAIRLFDTLAPLIKHPDFIKEAEWRLVSNPVDLTKRPIRLREGRTGIVPYIELIIAKDKTDPKFTVHTRIGPAIRHDPRNTNLAQIAYCDDFILQPFPVELSTTPYRHG